MSGLQPPLSSRTSGGVSPTCCCSVSLGRCDRCDLLVDLEDFHLVSVARSECRLALDLESCDRCAGCPWAWAQVVDGLFMRVLSRPTPKADAWPHTSRSAYQRVPSPKSLAWAGPHASGRTPSSPPSTQPEPATHPTEAINGHYRTRQTHRQRLPQPHQPPTPNASQRKRPRCLHPHSTLKSPTCCPPRSCGPHPRGRNKPPHQAADTTRASARHAASSNIRRWAPNECTSRSKGSASLESIGAHSILFASAKPQVCLSMRLTT